MSSLIVVIFFSTECRIKYHFLKKVVVKISYAFIPYTVKKMYPSTHAHTLTLHNLESNFIYANLRKDFIPSISYKS